MSGDNDSRPVYLDYNATTPLADEVKHAITRSLELWGNPSSGYNTGHVAKQEINVARANVADMLGAQSSEIVFTSGGTESNHLAIWTAIWLYKNICDQQTCDVISTCPSSAPGVTCHTVTSNVPHIVTCNIEHPAITAPLKMLETRGLCHVTWVPVTRGTGRWTVASVMSAITPDTCLVTMMLANNETGFIQPVKELFAEIKKNPPKTKVPILLHTDAAQAIGKIPVNVTDLNADLVTVVGHKFYGPRVGALYTRTGVTLVPMLYGGGQEGGLRPGTENTPMISGLGAAAKLVTDNLESYAKHLKHIKDYLRDQLIRNFKLVNSDEPSRLKLGEVFWRYLDQFTLPNTLSVRFGGFTGPELMSLCSDNVEASCGAACHTGAGLSSVLVRSTV